jgi:DNA end-binding protein Ku
MRAYWSGHISFSLVSIPIKMYSAVESGEQVSFNQLHEADYGRVGYTKVCKKCGKELSKEDIVRGFEHDKDQYVIIDDEELEALQLKSTKTIEIEAFVPAGEIDFALFDKPYILGPTDQSAIKTYELLRQAMEDQEMVAIGRVVLSGREKMIGIRPAGPALMGYQMRFQHEIRSVEDAPLVTEEVEVKEDQKKLAKQLIETLTRSFDDLDMADRYHSAVRELVEAKVEGREVVTVEQAETPDEAPDVMSALEESIKRAREAREPVKAERGKKKAASRPRTRKKTK